MLTKDEISDLNSAISRVIECEKAKLIAEIALVDAQNKLQGFLSKQYSK